MHTGQIAFSRVAVHMVPRFTARVSSVGFALAAIVGFCALAFLAPPATAHHAFAAEFDADAPVRLEGRIVKMELINPHSWIHLDVTNPDGTVSRWMVEGGPPNALFRRGFTEDSLPVGTAVIVEGFRARDGSLRANGRNVTLADGSSPFTGDFSTVTTQ